jgi:dihydrofolate reductase
MPAGAPTTVSVIAAVAANNVIGNAGRLPWRLPDDLVRFRRLTMGHPVLMGRKTYQSMGRPLSGRQNIILTRDAGLSLPGCDVVHALAEALEAAEGHGELFVIGGSSIYGMFLPLATRMYLTHVEGIFPGDSFFPEVRWEQWRALRRLPGRGEPSHMFVDYERITE